MRLASKKMTEQLNLKPSLSFCQKKNSRLRSNQFTLLLSLSERITYLHLAKHWHFMKHILITLQVGGKKLVALVSLRKICFEVFGRGVGPERRKIILIAGNAKCRHLKIWPVKGFWGRSLSVWGRTPYPPPFTQCLFIQTCKWGRGESGTRERLEGRLFTKKITTWLTVSPVSILWETIFQLCISKKDLAKPHFLNQLNINKTELYCSVWKFIV